MHRVYPENAVSPKKVNKCTAFPPSTWGSHSLRPGSSRAARGIKLPAGRTAGGACDKGRPPNVSLGRRKLVAYFSLLMARTEPTRPHFTSLLDESLIGGDHPPSQAAKAIRNFAICCVALVITQIGYSVFTNLAFITAAPSGLPLVVIGTIITTIVIGVLSIPLLYGWKSSGWYLAVGFLTFEGSFVLLLGNRYLFFGEPFSLTDLAENFLHAEFILEVVTALFAACLPLLLCWRRTVRTAFGVRRSTAVGVTIFGLVLRLLFTVVIQFLYQG